MSRFTFNNDDERQALRERIDNLECLDGLIQCIEDVESVKWEPGVRALLKLAISEEAPDESPVAFLHDLPPDVLLTGLRAMRNELGIRVQSGEGVAA